VKVVHVLDLLTTVVRHGSSNSHLNYQNVLYMQ